MDQHSVSKRRFCVLSGLSGMAGVVLLVVSFAIANGPPPDATRAELVKFGQQHYAAVLWGAWLQAVGTRMLSAMALALTPAALALAQPSPENLIHVEIGGMRNDKGQVLCALYSSADGFPRKSDKALVRAKSLISEGHAVCEFPGVTAGTYAVSVFHDENSNGKLDTNSVGIPREGVGASNNARGHFGPPKFEAAAFRFSGGRLELKITINYL